MSEVLGYQAYRGYVEWNKDNATGERYQFINWEKYNDYGRYQTYEAAYNDITTAYGGVFANSSDRAWKIETVYAPEPSKYIGQPVQDGDNIRTYTSPSEIQISAPSEPLKQNGGFGAIVLGAIAYFLAK